jgi:hypothetical protein
MSEWYLEVLVGNGRVTTHASPGDHTTHPASSSQHPPRLLPCAVWELGNRPNVLEDCEMRTLVNRQRLIGTLPVDVW